MGVRNQGYVNDVSPERADGFERTASKDTVAIGDETTFSLRNVGDERQSVGAIYSYDLHREDSDWRPSTTNSARLD